MPTAQSRALSIQEQQALELIAANVSERASAFYAQASARGLSEEEMAAEYLLLVVGAMAATAAARTAYLQAFAAANNQPAFKVPNRVLNPQPEFVLQDNVNPAGAIRNVLSLNDKWEKELMDQREALLKRMKETESADFSAMSEGEVRARARAMAAGRLGSLAESTVTSTADFVTRELLIPNKKVGALRRVVHPGACDRCTTVAGVLVFKTRPALRHDQCRCSFEPVYVDDPQYQERLFKYQLNVAAAPGARIPGMTSEFGRYSAAGARGTRARGRRQLAEASRRENSAGLRDAWNEFLNEEERRVNNLVKVVKSNTFKDWDVMVGVDEKATGGTRLPVITRR